MLCSIYPALPVLVLNSTTLFNPPQATSFLRFSLAVDRPVNATGQSTLGVSTQICGGVVAGAIEGTVLPLGVAFEKIFPDTDGSINYYTNKFYINTTAGDIVSGTIQGVTHYANNALHGFGYWNFDTGVERFKDTDYDMYVVEWMGSFNTGRAEGEIFKIGTSGRIDGQPTPALLPPGRS